jgi:glycerol transport system permease protein
MGDKHLFFWLLTNRMAPAAVFALPFFQLYSAVGLFDTHIAVALAHCLFNVPLAVWILEGFMSRRAEGTRRDRLCRRLFLLALLREDLPAADQAGIGVAAFFCFMFSWVELLLAKTLTAVEAKADCRDHDPDRLISGYELGLLAAAGTLTIIPARS